VQGKKKAMEAIRMIEGSDAPNIDDAVLLVRFVP
jgi:hypothetical protein